MTPQPKVLTPFLTAAVAIGRNLCREAVWDPAGGVCNWMGRSAQESAGVGGFITPTSAALGSDLYGGCPGVAWFLAQLAAATGAHEFRRTSLAAAACALRQTNRSPRAGGAPVSYYSGLVGIAFVLDRIAVLTGETTLGEQVDGLLEQARLGMTAPHVLDVIGGNAGAIPALLALSRDGQRQRPLARELAEQLGVELLQTAIRAGPAWTWDPQKAAGPAFGTAPLAGFAHGNAGLGVALFELYTATGRRDFLEGGRAAFAYEDGLFAAAVGNWPDLRLFRPEAPQASQFAVAWCHGAPGIALARLRAAALDPDSADTYLSAARVALATTAAELENVLKVERHDATLCHGAGGLSEVVWTGAQWLGDAALADTARSAARALIDRYALRGEWPTGVATRGPNPSLMLGTAGIGMHLLRLHDPDAVASPLIVTG